MSRPESSAGTDVVIIGAGYAGVIAANRLRSSLTEQEAERVRITMVNPRRDFVERIRLHELAAGSRDTAAIPLHDVLHRDVHLVEGMAERIDPRASTVDVRSAAGERHFHYDLLIYAVGSTASAAIAGSRHHAFLLADLDGAERARDAIGGGAPGQRVVVIGGGLTGVEAASEIAEQHPLANVTLLSSGPILETMRPSARRSVTRTLGRLHVSIEADARVDRIEPKVVELADGRSMPFDVCVVAASFSVPDLARVSGLDVDPTGRLQVDETLRSTSSPSVIGAGDATVLPASVGSHLRMGCAIALPLGGHAAETAVALLRGRPPQPVSIGFAVQCISLGRKRGYIQAVQADDTPRPFHLSGRPAAWFKEYICRLVVTGPRKERTKPGAYRSPAGPSTMRISR